ncbi:hypothetical protein AURDEDRAFT_162267 [Auricularia subglabra TFB-10046 SS5]|nr:hypothetical protein AURDEDRAFT_162267 [Auricularia subglabra TFB-10046 SS5]
MDSQARFGIVGHDKTFVAWTGILLMLHSPVRTVADAARALQRLHAYECGCEDSGDLADNAWLATLPHGPDFTGKLEEYFPRESERISADSVLTELIAAGSLPKEAIIMFGKDLDLATRGRRFSGVRRLAGDICRVSYNPNASLPNSSDFAIVLSTPGTCYVDKTEPVEVWYLQNNDKKMPVIRRPDGYGKSTFLSMCAATFNRRGAHTSLPIHRKCQGPDWRKPRPVLALDFANLDFCGGLPPNAMMPERDRMVASADAFMRQVAVAYCARYRPGHEFAFDDHWLAPFEEINAASPTSGLFLAIDNYTTPFLRVGMSAFSSIEGVIWERVLEPLLDPFGAAGGVVAHGLVVGPALHGLRPFSAFSAFAQITEDLSDSPEYASTIGFTRSDVLHLAGAVLGDRQYLIDAVLLACSLRPDDRAILCARDVLRILRMVQAGSAPGRGDSPDRIYPGGYDGRVRMDLDEDDMPGVPELQASQSHDEAFSELMNPSQQEDQAAFAGSKSLQSLVGGMDELQVDKNHHNLTAFDRHWNMILPVRSSYGVHSAL